MNNSLNEEIIHLSVGGVDYQTTLSTLSKDKDSMIAAMFSGRHSFQVDEKGRYFIDRDGNLFRYILNFLRNSEVIIPSEDIILVNELIREAEYFQLSGMLSFLHTMHEEAFRVLSYKEFLSIVNTSQVIHAPYIQVRGLSIHYLDLSNGNFQGADFSQCSLEKVNFTKANLYKAVFTYAVVQNTTLNEANMQQVNCTAANFAGNQLKNAKCRDAVFAHAKLGGADMRGCDLNGANLTNTNLLVANMEGCDLTMALLQGANLDGANIKGVRGLVYTV